MKIRRRDFLKISGAAALTGGLPRLARAADSPSVYDLERFGNARILHLTDTHAQLLPVYFREPSVNIGIGEIEGAATASGRPRVFSIVLESGPTAPTPMPSPRSISKNRRGDSASSAALHI